MARPTLADHERRIAALEDSAPLVVEMHGWFADAGLNNGTGAKLRLLGDIVAERKAQMDDREAIRRTLIIVARVLRLDTKVARFVWGVITAIVIGVIVKSIVHQ